jgi:hypothetical protein
MDSDGHVYVWVERIIIATAPFGSDTLPLPIDVPNSLYGDDPDDLTSTPESFRALSEKTATQRDMTLSQGSRCF